MAQNPGMTFARLTRRSLLNYIKEVLLIENRYYSINDSESLTAVAGTSDLEWQSKNTNWVYHNPKPATLTNLNVTPTITHDGTFDYIDYTNGKLFFTVAPTSVTASYSAEIISTTDGFPSPKKFEALNLPIIAVSKMPDEPRKGLGIGGGHVLVYNFAVQIFDQNESARDDLMDRVEEGLAVNLAVWNYNDMGFALRTDAKKGSINTDFDRSNKVATARIMDLSTRPIDAPTEMFKLRHRGEVSIGLEIRRATAGVTRF